MQGPSRSHLCRCTALLLPKVFPFPIVCTPCSPESRSSAISQPFQLHYHLPPLQPPPSKSNPPSTQDTISRCALIAGSRFFMRMAVLLRGGKKTMEANFVSIDQPLRPPPYLPPPAGCVYCSSSSVGHVRRFSGHLLAPA